jgi:amidase
MLLSNMNRRTFLEKTSAATVSIPVLWALACDSTTKTEPESSPQIQDFTKFELNEVSIRQLQAWMESGKYTARKLVDLYIERIEQVDKKGPFLNSVIEINPDAATLADQLDEERKSGKVRGVLHGIPVLIKDNIDTADSMQTTAGSIAMRGNYASEDAFIVKKLRNAGAIIIGKTNLSEWANFRSTRSSSGWSSRGGQTKNPYVLDRNPCGSSSGSGTAVAANLCAFAIGTETNGSIACPSSINGVVGLKPTVGLWSRSGIIPISHTQDTAGPMTRTVEDAALVLAVLSGTDQLDKATTAIDARENDYSAYLSNHKPMRIGVEKSFLKVHERVDTLFTTAISQMKEIGYEIVEIDFLSRIKIEDAEYELLQFEFKDGLNRYLSRSKGKVKSLEEVIAFNQANDSLAMPFFKQEILESSNKKAGLDSKEYANALNKVTSVRKIIDSVLKEQKLDAICGPANGPSWCTDLINGDFFTGYGMYSPAAMAGYPHITVPMGMVEGLPVGLTFFGSALSEGTLISIGHAYEQKSRNRIPPTFALSIESKKAQS